MIAPFDVVSRELAPKKFYTRIPIRYIGSKNDKSSYQIAIVLTNIYSCLHMSLVPFHKLQYPLAAPCPYTSNKLLLRVHLRQFKVLLRYK